MNGLVLVLIMIIVGALIGGVTNSLAIRMLFRPYRPLYIGKYRLPFTPGLIPKRRGELAVQMGKMVSSHLLTPESIRKKLSDHMFFAKMTAWVSSEIKKILRSKASLSEMIGQMFDVQVNRRTLVLYTEKFIYQKIHRYLEENQDKELSKILPSEVLNKVDLLVPELAKMITRKGADFFKGNEGQRQLEILLDKFLSNKGSLLNFLGTMFGSDRIVEKLQPEIVRFFEDPAAEDFIRKVLSKEWEKVQCQPLSALTQQINVEEIARKAANVVSNEIPVYQYIDKPLDEWAPRYEASIEKKWMPALMEQLHQFLLNRLAFFIEELRLEQIVQEQVDTFSVERLEALVLGISRREFKMITYLGALLGGLVGLIQAIFVTLFL